MAVYVDDAAIMLRGKPRFHLAADSVQELHAFCQQVGINRCWFHAAKNHPHYDITSDQRQTAIQNGALAVTVRELFLRTESGKIALARRIKKHSGDPEKQATLIAMAAPFLEIANQQELF